MPGAFGVEMSHSVLLSGFGPGVGLPGALGAGSSLLGSLGVGSDFIVGFGPPSSLLYGWSDGPSGRCEPSGR